MTNREAALAYLKRFCAGEMDDLEPLLAADMNFKGPWHTYTSSAEYLDSLRRDPPLTCPCKILSITENADSVAVFYEYQKPDLPILIAQLFKLSDQKIHDILLVFDTGNHLKNGNCQ